MSSGLIPIFSYGLFDLIDKEMGPCFPARRIEEKEQCMHHEQ
jgi:hypothetical protein